MGFIGAPMGWVLKWLATLCGGNFAAAVFLFTLLINLLMLPLTVKSMKSSAKQSMLRPKLEAIKQKYGNDKVKYSEAMQELYDKENVSMSGGCLPMLIRLIFMWAIYYVVINPLRYLGGVPDSVINAALKEFNLARAIDLVPKVAAGEVATIPADTLAHISFRFFGIDLTENPDFTFNLSEAKPIWVIPFLAFGTAMLTSIVSLVLQKRATPDQPTMSGMMLTMPIVSLIIGFTVPGALGFYWACSSLISGVLQVVMQVMYSPAKLAAKEQMRFVMKRGAYEEKLKAAK